jgi:hypothetical protein
MTQRTMSDKEISACRGAIGALQWVAVQTQPWCVLAATSCCLNLLDSQRCVWPRRSKS